MLPERYPLGETDLSGKRAIKFLFNEQVTIDEWGIVDPYVELIVGLDRVDAPGNLDLERSEWRLGPGGPGPAHRTDDAP